MSFIILQAVLKYFIQIAKQFDSLNKQMPPMNDQKITNAIALQMTIKL